MRFLRKIRNFYSYIILFALLSIVAFSSVKSYNTQYEQHREKINKHSGRITAECKINSFPVIKNEYIQARGKIIRCSDAQFEGLNFLFKVPCDEQKIEMGDTIRLTGTAGSAPGASNPGSFDYSDYLKSQNVTALFTADEGTLRILSHPAGFLRSIYRLRDRFIKRSDSVLPANASGLLRAIIGGDREDISEDDEEGFKNSGVYHIVAISGLHLNIFICMVYAYIRRLKIRRKYKAMLSVLSSFLIGVFVLFFTGFGVSVIRAFVMASIFAFASLSPRHYNSKHALLLTGFLIVIFSPCNLYSTAFQLSFLSTMGVLVGLDFLKYLERNKILPVLYSNSVGNTFCISLFTTLFTLLVTLRSFGFIPLYSWIANALILPVMPYLLGAGAFFTAFVWVSPSWMVSLAGNFITGLYAYVSFVATGISDLYGATFRIYADTLLYFTVCAIFFVLLSFMFFRRKAKALIITGLIFMVAVSGFLVYNVKDSDEITLTFADVGQGDCTLIQAGKTVAMIDSGTSSDSDYCESAIKDMLRYKNIRKIDVAIVTHYHSDHMNIMSKLLREGMVRKLILPAYYDSQETEAGKNREELLYAALKSNTEITHAKGGDFVILDGDKRFEFLLPDGNMYFENNDMSLITKLTYGNTKILFCGDAGEDELRKCIKKDIDCDIIKVAHHGGYAHAAKDFIEKASPDVAVVSCSKYNRYNHPDPRIIKILEDEGCRVERTDMSGAIIVKANRERIVSVEGMR